MDRILRSAQRQYECRTRVVVSAEFQIAVLRSGEASGKGETETEARRAVRST
jgi:hypothetical protein